MNEAPEPVLSPAETSALLDAMHESEVGGPPVEPIDLSSPERRVRGKLLAADKAGEAISVELGKAMLRHTEALSRVEIAPAELVPFGMLVSSLLPTWSIARMETDDGGMVLAIGDDVLTSFVLDRRLGAPLSSFEEQGEDRLTRAELSPVDRRVLTPVYRDVAAAMGEELSLIEVLPNAHSLPPTPEHEPLLVIGFTIQPGSSAPGRLKLVVDAAASRRLLPDTEVEPRLPSSLESYALRQGVIDTEVELVAMLGEAESTVSELLRLRVGDVVRLDASPASPIQVFAGDQIAIQGKPCVHHGNLAVRVNAILGVETKESR